MISSKSLLIVIALAGVSFLAHSQAAPVATRGQLLYTTHCISCHTTQVHWRDDRQAKDWNSLKMHVRRWQGNTGLQWDEADISEVARHLNETIYHFSQTADRVGVVSWRTTP
ncbi:cytochrome C [Acidovorax sp. A1169]|uniref:c-type cytochrome n=1 Tax=Acidovorax sp. A1169 TaxID=3059524 RepID=UPI002737CEE3|nr:cytochrome C [Acidovorax sp. A1169]MDP4076338.1 cytochrome C [Acidovorax sp. A1169]